MAQKTNIEIQARRKRLRRVAAIAGIAAALVCKTLPPRYHDACEAVTKIAAVSCGGGTQ